MKINTKFGPGAFVMDNTGAKMGIVKRVNIQMDEGTQEPIITYTVHGNGQQQMLDEKQAIGLTPTMLIEKKSEEKAA